jgi:sulfate transport system permease protein
MSLETAPPRPRRFAQDPAWLRWTLTLAAAAVLVVLIVVPVICVFVQAFAGGPQAFGEALADPDTLASIGLTLTVAPAAVVLNVVFGLAAAWAIARFRFPGRALLLAAIDLPFSVSPVVAGLVFVLLFGLYGVFGFVQREWGLDIVHSTVGLILATAFVTFPFVARELLPTMEAVGPDEELAAVSLGANGWQMFWRVTLPNIRWGLLYGVILCNARAMGEFGAVSVMSSRVPGESETMPLRVERLFQDFHLSAAFALASLLTLLALATLVAKTLLEHERGAPEVAAREEAKDDNN